MVLCSTSLPSRERGLKSFILVKFSPFLKSLPSRERGLKSIGCVAFLAVYGRSLRGSVD